MHNDSNETKVASAERESLERRLLEKLEALEQRLSKGESLHSENSLAQSNMPAATKRDIWERGDRAIAVGAGAAFLGGAIAQLPGAIVGGIFGILFGLSVKPKKAVVSEN